MEGRSDLCAKATSPHSEFSVWTLRPETGALSWVTCGSYIAFKHETSKSSIFLVFRLQTIYFSPPQEISFLFYWMLYSARISRGAQTQNAWADTLNAISETALYTSSTDARHQTYRSPCKRLRYSQRGRKQWVLYSLNGAADLYRESTSGSEDLYLCDEKDSRGYELVEGTLGRKEGPVMEFSSISALLKVNAVTEEV
ncbi:hypothetical protein Tco_1499074 [Tanacetum coccineum]